MIINIAHVIPGLFLLAIPYVSDHPFACIAFIALSFGFNGAASLTNYSNAHDLSPNYAGTLFAVMNSVATTAGFLSPLVVAYFTKHNVDMLFVLYHIVTNIFLINIFSGFRIQFTNGTKYFKLELPST